MEKQHFVKDSFGEYQLTRVHTEEIDPDDLARIEGSIQWFRTFGGHESPRYCGGKLQELISMSPDKNVKTIRMFTYSE